MPDDISKKITIDVEVTTDGQQQIEQYKSAFDSLRGSINGLSTNIGSLNNDLSKISDSLSKLNAQNKAAEESTFKLKDTVKDASESFKIWSEVIEGIKKNIITWETALTGGLASLTLYGPALLKWITSLVKGKEAIDNAKLSLTALNKALESSDYSNANKQLNELKINVDLAKKGFLDKRQVLQQYNDTLGKSMGQVNNLNQAEAKLVDKGPAYIKITLLKAEAQLALQDASKKAYEAEQAKIKSDDDVLTFMDKTAVVLKRGLRAVSGANGIAKAMIDAYADKLKTAAKRRSEMVEDANKQKEALLNIAKKFQANAADVAQKSGFNFFNGEITTTDSANGNDMAAKNDRFNVLAQQRIAKFTETEKLLKNSLTRQLQTTYEAYGNETIAENNHFQDELSKLDRQLKSKQITKKQYTNAAKQLELEHRANMAAIIDKYNQQDKEKTEQAQNELIELQIKGMKDGADKQIAGLKQQQSEKMQALDKSDEEYLDRIKKLYKELDNAKAANPNADTTALQQQVNAQLNLMQLNENKRVLLVKQTTDEITKIRQEARQKKVLEEDQADVNGANNPAKKLEAEKKLITDKYTFEVEQAQGNAAKLKELKIKYEQDITTLTEKAEQERKDFALKTGEEVAKAAFSMITNGIKSQSEAKIKGLQADETAELSNKSLTATQKQAIEAKYKKQEDQIKTKAFKDEQKVSIAQALINGAIAVTKAEAQTGVLGTFVIPAIIAQTAIQVATIVAQKPPQYAKGGLHYRSDGKGALLPGYSRTDNTNAYLRSGEAVVVSEAMRDPWARNLVSAINVAYGGRDFAVTNPTRGYAIGGIFTDGGNSNRYYNQPMNDQKTWQTPSPTR